MLPQVIQVYMLRRAPAAMHPMRWHNARDSFAAQLAALRTNRAAVVRGKQSTAVPAATATRASTVRRASVRSDAPATLAAWLATPKQRALADAITRASQHAGVEPGLSLAVAVAESSLDPRARSADGLSSGTFQVTAPTAADVRRRFATRELERPPGSDDVVLGVAHLRYLDDLFTRDARLGGELRTVAVDDDGERKRFAVAAYNAGEGRVARAQERAAALRRDPTRFESIRAFLPRITQRYVDRVMTYSGRDATRPQTASRAAAAQSESGRA